MNKNELELVLNYDGMIYKTKIEVPKLIHIGPNDFVSHLAFCCSWEINKSNMNPPETTKKEIE